MEDDGNIRELLRLYLEREGYEISEAENGAVGLSKWKAENPDMMLLDVMMPVMDGWQVCKEVRASNSSMPIIMITAKGETMDKVSGLELGADDYIVKPLEMREVVARVRAVFRRFAGDETGKLTFDKLTIDKQAYDLVIDGKRVDAPPKEIELLFSLRKARTVCSPAPSCSTTYGALITTATRARSMCTSNACAKSSKAFPINGSLRPFGAWVINLKPRGKRWESKVSFCATIWRTVC